jgi:glycosyltransferase involved in cell wall biosynthesis
MTPPISVVVPVFNGADFIAATLESIRRQDVPGVEVVLADGGSTDNTVRIAEAVGLANLRVISERDRGQLDALQKGVKAATGDVIVWINGDDIVMPGAFQTVLAAFRDHPEADYIYSDDAAFNEPVRGFYYGASIKGLNDLDHLLFYRQLYSECVYWRRNITKYLSDDYFDMRICTDYAFFLNMRWGRKGFWVPQRLGAFRIREGQASGAFGERFKAEFTKIRTNQARNVGFSPAFVVIARIVYWPWFALRQKASPASKRLRRKIVRVVTGDRARRAETEWFYQHWLKPFPAAERGEAGN